jgi:hypothetical protein
MIIGMLAGRDGQIRYIPFTRYNAEKHRNDIEIDFLLSNESKTKYKINPIEVKSSKNYTTTSLGRFKEAFGNRVDNQLIIHPKIFSVAEGITKIPPYMVWVALS